MTIAWESRGVRTRIWGLPEPWFHLLGGLVLAAALSAAPIFGLIGWYLAALVHEMGHTAAAWAMGVPAIPALGITAEAATVHGEQILPLALFIWMASGVFVWRIEERRVRSGALALLVISYPLLAFSPLRETVHLLSGHAFELVIGGLFLGRALSGGFSSSQGERVLYALLGWFLIGRNVSLTLGLLLSASARAEYASSGSYGTLNDYLGLATELGWSLEAIALVMSVIALSVAPLVIALWCWSKATQQASKRLRRIHG